MSAKRKLLWLQLLVGMLLAPQGISLVDSRRKNFLFLELTGSRRSSEDLVSKSPNIPTRRAHAVVSLQISLAWFSQLLGTEGPVFFHLRSSGPASQPVFRRRT